MNDPLDIDPSLLLVGAPDRRPARRGSRTELAGCVARIIHRADGFVVVRLIEGQVACGMERDGSPILPSVSYLFLGRRETHAVHGERFRWDTYSRDLPYGYDAMRAYARVALAGMGFGVRAMEKLWAIYGHESLQAVLDDPDSVATRSGLRVEVLRKVRDVLLQEDAGLKTRLALHEILGLRGLPAGTVDWCVDRWGASAPDVIRANPFVLLEARAPGCGFARVDAIYRDLGHRLDDPVRAAYCAWSIPYTDRSGHTWFRRMEVFGRVMATLGQGTDLAQQAIVGAVDRELLVEHTDRLDRPWVAIAAHARAEESIARHIARLHSSRARFWPNVEALTGLTSHQREALRPAFGSPVAVLTGGGGTGKTTTSMAIVHALYAAGLTPAVHGPTGRAAVRCTELLRAAEIPIRATTTHALLGCQWTSEGMRFRHNETNQLPVDVVVADEQSMTDTSLFSSMLRALPDGCHLLIVGDDAQLPPVGHGAPFRDIIASGWPVAKLTELHRNAGAIAEVARTIRDRLPVDLPDRFSPPFGNVRHLECDGPAAIVENVRQLLRHLMWRYGERPEWHPIDAVQIIVPRNIGGECSRMALNGIAQQELNPHGHSAPGNPYRVGDKIVCLRNAPYATAFHDREPADAAIWKTDKPTYVANGDTGRVLAVAGGAMIARFYSPDRVVRIPVSKRSDEDEEGDVFDGSQANFSLGYAVTAHKIQGAGCPFVIIPLDPDRRSEGVASRQWLYTAVTRASDRCITIGARSTFDAWLSRDQLTNRATFLAERLRVILGLSS